MYILLSDSPGIGQFIVRLFTRSKWSHVDIVLGDDLNDPLTPLVGATAQHGVISYDLNDRLKKATRAVAIKIDPNGSSEDDVLDNVRNAKQWLARQVGKDYDWGAIFFAIGLNRNWKSEEDWFCSELAAAFALRCGMPVVDPEVNHRVTPQDIYNGPFPKVVVK